MEIWFIVFKETGPRNFLNCLCLKNLWLPPAFFAPPEEACAARHPSAATEDYDPPKTSFGDGAL